MSSKKPYSVAGGRAPPTSFVFPTFAVCTETSYGTGRILTTNQEQFYVTKKLIKMLKGKINVFFI